MSKRRKICFTLGMESVDRLDRLSNEMDIAKSRLVDLAVEKPRKFEVITDAFESNKNEKEV